MDPSNTEQTPTIGTILLAKTQPEILEMITSRTMQMQSVPKLPRFARLQIRGFKPKQGTEINASDIRGRQGLFRITQRGPYLTFEQAFGPRRILPGMMTMEHGTWTLYIPQWRDNGFYKLFLDSKGILSGVYVESGNVGSRSQATEAGTAMLNTAGPISVDPEFGGDV